MGDTTAFHCSTPRAEPNAPNTLHKADSQAAERLRVQELLRYFHPPNASIEKQKPQVALDTSLTAYAQLSALKLDCQRSFISLIDHEKQYIIAEATRTVSLESEDIHGCDDDAIYLGATTLDIVWGVCPNTIKLFTSTDGSLNVFAPYIKANQSYYVMNDLSKIPEFETRPYVAGWPHMRYYAEVPIHSPSGLTIGSLCVVDNKPREGLDTRGIVALTEIAHAVMDHLELVMSKVQRKRAERMIQGLGLFVEGSDSIRQWWMDSEQNSRNTGSGTRKMRVHDQAGKEFGSQSFKTAFPGLNISDFEHGNQRYESLNSLGVDRSDSKVLTQLSADSVEVELGHKSMASPAVDSLTMEPRDSPIFSEDRVAQSSASTTRNGSISKQSTPPNALEADLRSTSTGSQGQPRFHTDLEEMLSRAADLIREAVGLDGVVFLDPRLGRFNAPHDEQPRAGVRKAPKDAESPSRSAKHDQMLSVSNHSPDAPTGSAAPPKDRVCKILAFSTRASVALGDVSACPMILSERVLHHIIERFPRGGVLKFDAEGFVSRSELELAWYNNLSKAQEQSPSHIRTGEQRKSATESHLNDSADVLELSRVLPNARSIILFPLWNSSRDKLFAYNIAWTANSSRVFQQEDFAYLASFGNSIMAELSRLGIIAADRAKADFISSISHELRSPLHGVLASAELLKALTNDITSIDIINTIEACGSTLLDTMDNLLTFAKINNFTVNQPQEKSTVKLSALGQGPPQPLKSLTSEVDLSFLVEEVMNANIAGHQFRKTLEDHSSHSIRHAATTLDSNEQDDTVTVICDIDSHLNWTFNTQGGAWKRILMNLLGNSLKYTTTGFIHVRLSQGEKVVSAHATPKTRICLSVEDSGKGISDEYLKHHLFTPFLQEDPLCPGTGLGLSIVRQLVASINGTIDIRSEAGYGTKVNITALLDSLTESAGAVPSSIMCVEAISLLKGRRLGLVALDMYPDIEETPTGILSKQARRSLVMKSSLVRSVTKSFGLKTTTVVSLDSDLADIDILVTTEANFRNAELGTGQPGNIPLIVLSANLTLDYRPVSYENGPVIYLSQPFGPQKLARALESCVPYCRLAAGSKSGLHGASIRPVSLPVEMNSEPKTFAQDLTTTRPSPVPIVKDSLEQVITCGGRPRALLVEDNPINLKLLVAFLQKLGYPYATATDGLQAVEAYQSCRGDFDIIFMDIQMPKMDGMVASFQIRKFEQRESLSRTTIIALTGLASADAQEQAVLSGIDLFLTKPVPLKSLKAVIEDRFPPPEINS